MTYRGYVRNGQITLDPGERLPEGAYVSVEVLQAQRPNGTARDRHELLRMPVEQRRELLKNQAERLKEHYETDADPAWRGLTANHG